MAYLDFGNDDVSFKNPQIRAGNPSRVWKTFPPKATRQNLPAPAIPAHPFFASRKPRSLKTWGFYT